jgi:RNA polymerase sigma-70 factor (ECF subfamily)
VFIFTILAAIGKAAHSGSGKEVQLMKKIKAKDANALEELYNQYNGLLFGLIISIVKKKEEAEDILQEVFMNIWQKAHTFDEERGNVYGWLVTMTRNKAIDRTRSKDYKTQEKASVNLDDPAFSLKGDKFDPLETTIYSDRAKMVKKALAEIPEAQREVLKIAYYRGMTQSEIADHLNIPLGTVKTRTRQGMLKLRDLLESLIQ